MFLDNWELLRSINYIVGNIFFFLFKYFSFDNYRKYKDILGEINILFYY